MLPPEEVAKNRQMMRYARQWIKSLSLTQSKIAAQMNVSEPTISNWLTGKQSMSTSQLIEFCEVLGISIEALLTEPGNTEQAVRIKRLLDLGQRITDEELAAIEALVGRRANKTE